MRFALALSERCRLRSSVLGAGLERGQDRRPADPVHDHGKPRLTALDDSGPALTPAQAAALHDQPGAATVAWFAIPAPGGAGVIARAHTMAHDGSRMLPGHLAAANLAGLQAVMLAGLTFDPAPAAGSSPGRLGWWWS